MYIVVYQIFNPSKEPDSDCQSGSFPKKSCKSTMLPMDYQMSEEESGHSRPACPGKEI